MNEWNSCTAKKLRDKDIQNTENNFKQKKKRECTIQSTDSNARPGKYTHLKSMLLLPCQTHIYIYAYTLYRSEKEKNEVRMYSMVDAWIALYTKCRTRFYESKRFKQIVFALVNYWNEKKRREWKKKAKTTTIGIFFSFFWMYLFNSSSSSSRHVCINEPMTQYSKLQNNVPNNHADLWWFNFVVFYFPFSSISNTMHIHIYRIYVLERKIEI